MQAAFFQPREHVATDALNDSPGRRLRDAIEPIATISFWAEPAYEAYAGLGLDFLGGYVLSRSYPLGEAAPAVVAAAFGVFDPGLVEGLCRDARQVASFDAIGAARLDGARQALTEVLGDEPGVHEVVELLRRACGAIGSPMGRPLAAGLLGLDWPDDDLGALWHASTVLRELRGDGHLAACAAQGLTGVEANILTELRVGFAPLEYTATRGWPAEVMQAGVDRLTGAGLVDASGLTDSGRRLRDDVEAATERSVRPALDAIGDHLDDVVDRVGAWSQRVVDRGWFPPDPYKRAAG